MPRRWVGILLLATLSFGAHTPRAPAQSPADDFFEKKVRPTLVEHCQHCHGAKKQEARLRLDSAEGVRTGSDNGLVLVAGAPEKSRLIATINYGGKPKMPPTGKLSAPAIAALTSWVKHGAVWPAEAVAVDTDGTQHWAFQLVRKPDVPAVKRREWVRSPVDAFILARLEAAGLAPSPPADRRTLIRRATFDLHGLPPTPEEVAAFEADRAPGAFARLVDRLLASPRYGERWGRHWLDVARYADTKGYVRLNDNPTYPTAWTYRDYVIRALNEDLPYDRFILEQLAADQLNLGEDKRALAAMGFLTLGERFINSQHDIIDDRIDVVTRGLLGLTVTCARCHDHKYDPIPTRDYYALYGVFASSVEPRVPPLITRRAEQTRHAEYLKGLRERTDKFDRFIDAEYAKLTGQFRARAGEYLLAGQKEEVQPNFLAVMFLVDTTKELNPVMLQRWARYLQQSRKRHDPLLAPWHGLAALPQAEFASRVPELIARWHSAEPQKRVNAIVLDALSRKPPDSLADAAARYGELFRDAEERWRVARKKDPAAPRLDDPAWEEIRRFLYDPEAPPTFPVKEIEDYFFVDTKLQSQFHQQQRLVEDWIATPGAAPHALTLVDAPTPHDPRVFKRGNPSNPGPAVARQFLEVLSGPNRRPFTRGSGRLELARAIADKSNPLTARVMVNRVWLHHFGTGIVRTPSDFGLRGERPSHPELLDYLASRFTEDGWSLKKLHRLIMLSAAYQQQSRDNPAGRAKDPDNALLWRMNRQRLDWEALRDALLAVGGNLDLTMGGPSVQLLTPPFAPRRSVYAFVDRLNLPGVLRSFDFAGPDATSPQRYQTTVPQQALFLLNSPFMQEQARRLAARPDVLAHPKLEQRIEVLHRLLYGRSAQPDEIALAQRFLANAPATAWQQYAQALLLANEFSFID